MNVPNKTHLIKFEVSQFDYDMACFICSHNQKEFPDIKEFAKKAFIYYSIHKLPDKSPK